MGIGQMKVFTTNVSNIHTVPLYGVLIHPVVKVGLVMGKGGETIKSICAQSGAHCQVYTVFMRLSCPFDSFNVL